MYAGEGVDAPGHLEAVAEQLGIYSDARNNLVADEQQGLHNLLLSTRRRIAQQAKAELAIAAQALYAANGFRREQFEDGLATASHMAADEQGDPDELLATHYTLPFSLHKPEASAIEAAVTTAENISLAREFALIGHEHIDGMLLSGSSAWGAYYAPRGRTQFIRARDQQNHLNTQCDERRSDVDLLAITPSSDAIEAAVEAYVNTGLLPKAELIRVAAFKEMYEGREADIFSVRTHRRDVEVSLHFMNEAVFSDMTNLEPIDLTLADNPRKASHASGIPRSAIDIIKDFRPNAPNGVGKSGVYSVDSLLHRTPTPYIPETTPVRSKKTEELLGYIATSPVGGAIELPERMTYCMGPLSFFPLIAPLILHERNTYMTTQIENMERNVGDIVRGAGHIYIPRQDRMPTHTTQSIAERLIRLS